MLCSRFVCWLKGHNSVATLEKLWLHGKVNCHGRRQSGKRSEKTLHTWMGLEDSGLFATDLRQSNKSCFHSYQSATCASTRRKPHNPERLVSPSPKGSRITRKNVEEIQQVVEDHLDKIHRFAIALDCSFADMKCLVEMDTRLVTSFSEQKVTETIKHLKRYGFPTTEILSNPPTFCLSIKSLQTRLKQMEEVRCNRSYVLKFGPKKFREMMKYYEDEKKVMKSFLSRETYLAVLFGVEETDILQACEKHSHIETLAVARLTQAYNTLVQYGFSQSDIWEDLDILILPPEELKSRLDRMNTAGLLDKALICPHLRYHGKRQFDVAITGWVEDQRALEGHTDKVSYLSARLQCSPDEIQSIYERYKMLKPLRPRRWKVILDILLDDMEIPPQYVVNQPVVLGYSAKRLRHRGPILLDEAVTDPKTVIDSLIMSEKKFAAKFNQLS